jgi:hypothetical protein
VTYVWCSRCGLLLPEAGEPDDTDVGSLDPTVAEIHCLLCGRSTWADRREAADDLRIDCPACATAEHVPASAALLSCSTCGFTWSNPSNPPDVDLRLREVARQRARAGHRRPGGSLGDRLVGPVVLSPSFADGVPPAEDNPLSDGPPTDWPLEDRIGGGPASAPVRPVLGTPSVPDPLLAGPLPGRSTLNASTPADPPLAQPPGGGAPDGGAPDGGASSDGAPGDQASGDQAPGDGVPGDGVPRDAVPDGAPLEHRLSDHALSAGMVPLTGLAPEGWIDRSRPAAEVFQTALRDVLYGRLLPLDASRIVIMRLGLDGMPARTFREIGQVLGRAAAPVGSLFRAALRTLAAGAPDLGPGLGADRDTDTEATHTAGAVATAGAAGAGAAAAADTGAEAGPGGGPDDHARDDHARDDHARDDHAPDDHAPDDRAPDDRAPGHPARDDRAPDDPAQHEGGPDGGGELALSERTCGVLRLIATEVVGDPTDPAMPYRLRMFVQAALPCAPVEVAADVVLRLGYTDLNDRARPLARAVARA